MIWIYVPKHMHCEKKIVDIEYINESNKLKVAYIVF